MTGKREGAVIRLLAFRPPVNRGAANCQARAPGGVEVRPAR